MTKQSRRTASRLIAGIAALGGAGLLVAQAISWTPGGTIAAGDRVPLALRATDTPMSYQLDSFGKELHFQFLRLSGERPWPMEIVGLEPGRHAFSGNQASLTINAVGPDQIVAEFKTTERRTGLAFVEISEMDTPTTATLSIDSQEIIFDTANGPLLIQAVGAKAFREGMQGNYRIVMPLDENSSVRLSVSTTAKSEADIKALSLP